MLIMMDSKKRNGWRKMFRCIGIGMVVALGLVTMIGSGDGDDDSDKVQVDASYNGEEVTLDVEDLLVVTLDANATTGFSWNLSAISDQDVIEKVSDEYIAPEQTGMVGVGGQEVWKFRAMAPGTAEITMVYIQPWVQPPDPAGTFSIIVVVE